MLDFYRESVKKISLSETTRTRALVFGMQHHLVDHSQGSSNYVTGAKNWLRPGGYMFYIGLCRENMKKCSCLKPHGIEH